MDLKNIKGIGEKTEKLFHKLGIYEASDLLLYFPHAYIHYEAVRPIASLSEGETVAIQGMIEKDATIQYRNGLQFLTVQVRDLTARIKLSYFNAAFMKNVLKAGSIYVFYGKVRSYKGTLSLNQPKLYRLEDYKALIGTLEPVYGQTKGLSNKLIQKAIRSVFQLYSENKIEIDETIKEELSDYIPEKIRYNRKLKGMEETLQSIHFPKSMEAFEQARKRLAYNELFLFSLALLNGKKTSEEKKSVYPIKRQEKTEKLIDALPFHLTKGQEKALREIQEDLESEYLMNRLLQGDVGSGKTIIAFIAMLDTALSGYQAALMAPTELLAQQHYEKLTKLIEENALELQVVLLTGSMTAKEKRKAYEEIELGKAQLIIGTHALFQEKLNYRELALVITDEQHRFGVLQRKELSEKGVNPHTLLMSATPIPRTLALLLYIDVKVSRITELPSNRLPIKNALILEDSREKAYQFIYKECKKGRQAYIICPMVDQNDSIELKNVVEEVPLLRKTFPKDIRIAGLHGKMQAKEKSKIMQAFLDHEIDILVSTTVVEVGVDVANATVILVEHAERFGLAQLHQLRGRVGRSGYQSYCILIDSKNSKQSKERLSVLARSNDGFYIAEEDLKLRGPGDIFGFRQSGEMLFSIADVYRDRDLLEKAREDADYILGEDPELCTAENEKLKDKLEHFVKESGTL